MGSLFEAVVSWTLAGLLLPHPLLLMVQTCTAASLSVAYNQEDPALDSRPLFHLLRWFWR